MKRLKRRIYAIVLSLAMIISIIPGKNVDAVAKISFNKSSIKITKGISKKISLKIPAKYKLKKIFNK